MGPFGKAIAKPERRNVIGITGELFMKIKFLLFAVFIFFIFASCYQPSSIDSNANGGAVAFRVNAPEGLMRSPAAGQDGEIRIMFFEAGQLEEGKAYYFDDYLFPPP